MRQREENTSRRLSLKNDYLFQRMFGEEEGKSALIGLLNAILGREGQDAIADVTVLGSKRLTRRLIRDKEAVLDVHCETNSHELINVEMQVRRFPHMEKRSMFYVAKLFASSIRKGQDHSHLKKTIAINLLDHALFPYERFHSTYHLYEDVEPQYRLTDLWELHFIEFAKFRQAAYNSKNSLHRWLKYMDETLSDEQLKELMEMDPLIREAEARMTELSEDEETRLFYEAREKGIRDNLSLMNEARREGLEEGIEKGMEKGIQQVAVNMLRRGMDIALVAELTGLTVEQIKAQKLSRKP